MKKGVFRQSALDKMNAVEQLDRMIKVTSPMSWLALASATLVIVFVIVWSFVGTLPSTITANGVIVNASTSTNTYIAPATGTIQILKSEGEFVYYGDKVVRIIQNGESKEYTSDQRGWLTDILIDNGTAVRSGEEVFRVSPYMSQDQEQVVVCYVPVSDAKKIERGYKVNVMLSSADSNTYGYMTGRVINIDNWATSSSGIQSVVGTNNSMESLFVANGSVCAVTCELQKDTERALHKNDYYWSNEKGFQLEINDRMMCTVRIITEEVRPITKLFSKLKDIWGE